VCQFSHRARALLDLDARRNQTQTASTLGVQAVYAPRRRRPPSNPAISRQDQRDQDRSYVLREDGARGVS
jgi:hypothetical protein